MLATQNSQLFNAQYDFIGSYIPNSNDAYNNIVCECLVKLKAFPVSVYIQLYHWYIKSLPKVKWYKKRKEINIKEIGCTIRQWLVVSIQCRQRQLLPPPTPRSTTTQDNYPADIFIPKQLPPGESSPMTIIPPDNWPHGKLPPGQPPQDM